MNRCRGQPQQRQLCSCPADRESGATWRSAFSASATVCPSRPIGLGCTELPVVGVAGPFEGTPVPEQHLFPQSWLIAAHLTPDVRLCTPRVPWHAVHLAWDTQLGRKHPNDGTRPMYSWHAARSMGEPSTTRLVSIRTRGALYAHMEANSVYKAMNLDTCATRNRGSEPSGVVIPPSYPRHAPVGSTRR